VRLGLIGHQPEERHEARDERRVILDRKRRPGEQLRRARGTRVQQRAAIVGHEASEQIEDLVDALRSALRGVERVGDIREHARRAPGTEVARRPRGHAGSPRVGSEGRPVNTPRRS